MAKLHTGIQTFAVEGCRLRDYSRKEIERLASVHLVTIQRNRKGYPVRADFLPPIGTRKRSMPVGTRYSFQRKLPSGCQVWELMPVPERAAFLAVPESIAKRSRKKRAA